MRISDVRAGVIGKQEPHSGGSVWTFVRVYTDEGIVGTGECNSAGPSTGRHGATRSAPNDVRPWAAPSQSGFGLWGSVLPGCVS